MSDPDADVINEIAEKQLEKMEKELTEDPSIKSSIKVVEAFLSVRDCALIPLRRCLVSRVTSECICDDSRGAYKLDGVDGRGVRCFGERQRDAARP